jgi:hypothetical protein
MDDSPAVRLTVAFMTLAGIALMCWAELPPWQRQILTRSARRRLRAAAARLARASGQRAMGRELAGTAEHDAGYGWTLRLSTWRDRL